MYKSKYHNLRHKTAIKFLHHSTVTKLVYICGVVNMYKQTYTNFKPV